MGLVCKVLINGKVNDLSSSRVLSFKQIDNSSLNLDSLEITINNADKQISIPNTDTQISLNIGYDSLYDMGQFQAQYIEAKSDILHINAISCDLSKAKEVKTQVFKQTTLGEIIDNFALSLGLNSQVAGNLKEVPIDYYLQENKTNLQVLLDLANIFRTTVNIKNANLIFLSKENAKQITIDENNILSIHQRNIVDKFYKGSYWDLKEKSLKTIQAGEAPFKTLTNNISKNLANTYVNNVLNDIKNNIQIEFTVIGDPNIQAGLKFKLETAKFEEFKGIYFIDKVTHKYNNTYTCTCLATKQV